MSYAPGGWGAFLALSRDPANRSQWLAGADVGGLFVSVDDGVSWQSCNAGISTLWVMAIAFSQRGPILGTSAGVYRGAEDARILARGRAAQHDCGRGALSSRLL